ncbi:hypothetical protein SCB71_17090 [Herbiconiux sp. KACC 21604]|uniref:hypothetical protein n=1 Tax=unclassified Herbiconiux TaxID=2618217 RepID=UPI0014920748|nr:hypothetical protein [Herbiconiux sp. SALV-R1]QJU54802.1 hypothetical protein HL652_15045 [Herbiconiux sp. SALV-R1]WPO85917.1 hypothetical protein SCB71_17090 [Herbiconiux sp. KACC 21604]
MLVFFMCPPQRAYGLHPSRPTPAEHRWGARLDDNIVSAPPTVASAVRRRIVTENQRAIIHVTELTDTGGSLILEPWGTEYKLSAGSSMTVEMRLGSSPSRLEVARVGDAIILTSVHDNEPVARDAEGQVLSL